MATPLTPDRPANIRVLPTADFHRFQAFIRAHGAIPTQMKWGTKGPWYDFLDPTCQTSHFLDSIPWSESYSAGYICGIAGWQEFDIDSKSAPVPYSVVEAVLKALGLPADYPWVIRSGSGLGWRIVFICQDDSAADVLSTSSKIDWPSIDGSFDHVEYRRRNCQSILVGQHPTGPGYRFAHDKPRTAPAARTGEQVVKAYLTIASRPDKPKLPATQPRPTSAPIYIQDWQAGKAMEYIQGYLDELKGRSVRRNDFINDRVAWNIGRLAHYIGNDGLLIDRIYDAAITCGYVAKDGEAQTRATIASGFNAGKDKPRYPFSGSSAKAEISTKVEYLTPRVRTAATVEPNGLQEPMDTATTTVDKTAEKADQDRDQDLAAGSHPASFIIPKITLGDMVRLLNDDPKQAVITLPKSEQRSNRSAYRDRATFINSNYSPGSGNRTGTTAADRHYPATWIRNVFPQGDPLTALIPSRLLTPELFAEALTADEIDDLGDLAFMVDLTGKQRKDVEDRIRKLNLIRRKVNELDHVRFVIEDGQTFDKVADLRTEVLRQACQYFATDQATGEITDCGLSNTIQACLIGTTIGALPSVRRRGGIEQTPQAVQEKAITSAQDMPPNAYETFTRSGQLYAKVQPVSRQRVGDRPEPKPRAERRRKASDISQGLPAEHAIQPVVEAPPTPRRPWREVYAACLMCNLLHHAQVEADETEPLDLLAGKLRNLIKPISEPPAVAKEVQAMLIEVPEPELIEAQADEELHFVPRWDQPAQTYTPASDELKAALLQMEIDRRRADLYASGFRVTA